MGVYGHVPGCARQGLSFPVRNVLFGFWVTVVLGHAKVWRRVSWGRELKGLLTDDMDGVGSLGSWDTDQEVIRFDVAINEGLVVDGLDTSDLKETS